MEDPIYPPKRPNLQHFEKPKQQKLISELPPKISDESVDSLKRNVVRKRVERAKAKQ